MFSQSYFNAKKTASSAYNIVAHTKNKYFLYLVKCRMKFFCEKEYDVYVCLPLKTNIT